MLQSRGSSHLHGRPPCQRLGWILCVRACGTGSDWTWASSEGQANRSVLPELRCARVSARDLAQREPISIKKRLAAGSEGTERHGYWPNARSSLSSGVATHPSIRRREWQPTGLELPRTCGCRQLPASVEGVPRRRRAPACCWRSRMRRLPHARGPLHVRALRLCNPLANHTNPEREPGRFNRANKALACPPSATGMGWKSR